MGLGLSKGMVGDFTKKRLVVSPKVRVSATNDGVGWGLSNQGLSKGKVGDLTKKRLEVSPKVGVSTTNDGAGWGLSKQRVEQREDWGLNKEEAGGFPKGWSLNNQ